MSQCNDVQNVVDLMARNKMRPLQEPHFELTTFDLIPIDTVKIRRDKTSVNGKIRNKCLNLSSNVTLTKILINDIDTKFKISRGFGIVKVNVSELLCNYNSGFHQLDIKLEHFSGLVHKTVTVDFRAKKHNNTKKLGLFGND